jgi:chaperonin cofactor prefoldin
MKATLREVKKESPNKGRFFWTCATYPFCKFFLWRDDALIRESGLAADSDARSAMDEQSVPPRPKTPTLRQKALESFGIEATPSRGPQIVSGVSGILRTAPPKASFVSTQTATETGSPVTPSSKRKRSGKGDWDQDCDLISDLDSDEERQLAEITDQSAEKVTPKRVAEDVFSTPPTNRRTADIVGGLPTPSVSRTLFPPSEAKRYKTVSFDEPLSSDSPTTPSKTPSSHSGVSPVCPASSPSEASVPDVTEEVMNLLSGQQVDAKVLRSVNDLLLTFARKAKGVSLGRDSARAALNEKDKKIAELQEKIRDLENKEEYNRKRMTKLKSQLIQMYEDN